MIDRHEFVEEFQALGERFGRDVSPEMIGRYYGYLALRMHTGQFQRAAGIIYAEDTFWPPPIRFLEVLQLDHESAAEAAWERTLEEVRRNEAPPLDDLDDATVAALRAVGKHRTIALTNEDRLDFVRKRFIDAYLTEVERDRAPALNAPASKELTDENPG